MVRCCYRSHINNPHLLIYDADCERPRPARSAALAPTVSGNRRKRLERLEQRLADLLREEALVNCICLKKLFVGSREKFLSEMNKTCPVHGFRRLGVITLVYIGPERKDRDPD